MLVAGLYGKVYRVGEVVRAEDYSDVRTEDSIQIDCNDSRYYAIID